MNDVVCVDVVQKYLHHGDAAALGYDLVPFLGLGDLELDPVSGVDVDVPTGVLAVVAVCVQVDGEDLPPAVVEACQLVEVGAGI